MDNNTTNKTQRVRGSARIQPDGTFDFKPDGQGVKKIEEVRQARKSRCYRTADNESDTGAHRGLVPDRPAPACGLYEAIQERQGQVDFPLLRPKGAKCGVAIGPSS